MTAYIDTLLSYCKSQGISEKDIVPVVRCKYCKYCITHEKILFCIYKGNIGDWRYRTETDFCSRGKRKDEVEE